MANIYPTKTEYDQYWESQQRRAKGLANSAISPIYVNARDRVTTDALGVLNNRKYLRIENPRRRLIAVKRDPKIKQVEKVIIRAAEQSLNAIFNNLAPSYEVEVMQACKVLYPEFDKIGNCNVTVSKAEQAQMRQEPFLGRTYREWNIINRDNAIKQWHSQFRQVMTGEIRTETAVSRDVQLVQAMRKILNTQESKTKTLFNNAMIQVSRKAQADLEGAIWQ